MLISVDYSGLACKKSAIVVDPYCSSFCCTKEGCTEEYGPFIKGVIDCYGC